MNMQQPFTPAERLSFGVCPECGEPVERPEPYLFDPEPPMDFLGVRAVCATRAEMVAVRLGCGHVMRGATWTPDSPYVWTP